MRRRCEVRRDALAWINGRDPMHRRTTRSLATCTILAAWLHGTPAQAKGARISYDAQSAPVAFAVADLDAALRAGVYQIEHRPLEAAALPQPSASAGPSLRISILTREQESGRGSVGSEAATELGGLRAEGFLIRQSSSGQA